jgi:pimeloyl-ACP methyl ester carboxylesterase/DNA-binding CsgD family transcriptional regulator
MTFVPGRRGEGARQRVRYLRTADGVRLAWSEAGQGSLVVKAANWLTHLELEWTSPVWRHWLRLFADRFRYVRYDERGCGMTDWNVGDLGFDRWLGDLEAVVDAAAPEGEQFAILGISQGCAAAVAYAVKHPERVSKLLLYGGYARGVARRGDPEQAARYRAIAELVGYGWGNAENPVFRRLFTSRFFPGGTEEQFGWFDDLCLKTATAENARKLMEARAVLDVTHLLPRVSAPTLVVHGREDSVVPIDEGRFLASEIPNAQFLELDSKNHVLLESEPAWGRFSEAALEFLGSAAPRAEDPVFAALSTREREVLSLLTEGLGNAQIASRLEISEKTVRNHLSSVFDKLGVFTRAQAMVFARDRGFVP